MNDSFSKPKLVQVGLVVRDLDETMRQFKLLPARSPTGSSKSPRPRRGRNTTWARSGISISARRSTT